MDRTRSEIAELMYQLYSDIMSQEDCDAVALDVADTMIVPEFNRAIKEWLHRKVQFSDYIVRGFSLVETATKLNQLHPNIPVAALLLYLEQHEIETQDNYRGIAGLAGEYCIADSRLLTGEEPCQVMIYTDGTWYFLGTIRDPLQLKRYAMWQVLLLNPTLIPLAAQEPEEGTSAIRLADGNYLLTTVHDGM